MFDMLFGWRKASKCKKLIRRVQCRLNLLKNKRRCIVKQLREDVAELLRHGHKESAFDRVEQLFKDESMVEIYDLLDNYCEYIIINLPYIRKHKDCPDDIKEAVSTLIFASARFGDLPELLTIRKLFRQRYGERFAMSALELLSGNLVNHQIMESLHIKNIPDEVKFRLLDDIGRTFLEPPETKTMSRNVSSSVQTQKGDEDPGMQIFNIEETDGKIVHVDLSSEKKKNSCSSYKDSDSPTFTPSMALSKPECKFPYTVQNSAHIIEEKQVNSLQYNTMVKFTISGVTDETDHAGMAEESSSDTLVQLPEEMVYLDDIEEFVSPLSKDEHCQDQRLFVFKSSAIPLKHRIDYTNKNDLREKILHRNKKTSNSSGRTRKAGGKRLRRSMSIENRNVMDVECASYYGDRLSSYNSKSLYQRKHQKMISVEDRNQLPCPIQENEKHACSVEVKSSLSFVEYRKNDMRHIFVNGETATCKLFSMQSSQDEEMDQFGVVLPKCSFAGEPEILAPHLRAMSLPLERLKESPMDNVLRSNSLPLQQINGPSYRHIHPKLPDYDELTAKFMALKKANLQNKQK